MEHKQDEKSAEELEIARLNSLLEKTEEEKKVLIEEKDAIENYMGVLVHDLRAPIANIIGLSDLLLDDEYSKEEKIEFAQNINYVSNGMLQLMSSYLLLHKFENSKGVLVKKTKTVFELTDGVKKIFENKYKDNKLRVSFKKSEDQFVDLDLFKKEIEVDRDLYFSALTNLIGNALEASPEAVVTINFYSENNLFCASISNEKEIPKEIQEKLFKKFNTSKAHGTGLGLFSAKRIAEAHGGDLVYKPLLGGTCFILSIPFN